MKAYNQYGYFVHVSDEILFGSKIDPNNHHNVIDHGRSLKNDILKLDTKIDHGDGKNNGKVRWYDCYGIDCDEGWENYFFN